MLTDKPLAEGIPDEVGGYRYVKLDHCNDVLLCRLEYPADAPVQYGAVRVPGDPSSCHPASIIVAYSSRCTHMGCYLLPRPECETDGALPEGILLRCPCHWSCFDLGSRGMTVMGPATDWLPQVHLTLSPENSNGPKVRLMGWIERHSVGRGVPYGRTSTNEES